jgi:hypothetical protein
MMVLNHRRAVIPEQLLVPGFHAFVLLRLGKRFGYKQRQMSIAVIKVTGLERYFPNASGVCRWYINSVKKQVMRCCKRQNDSFRLPAIVKLLKTTGLYMKMK